jgi:hypothetical protein
MPVDLRRAIRSWPAFGGLRLARLNLLSRFGVLQDMSPLLATDPQRWTAALEAAQAGKRVLIATNTGGHFGIVSVDRLLALALTLRGANVGTVLCDGALPACQMCEFNLVPNVERLIESGPPRVLCNYCHGAAARSARPLGLPTYDIEAFLDRADRAEAEAFASAIPSAEIPAAVWHGLPVGEHALAGTLRYFARGTLEDEPLAEGLLRRFCEASVLAAMAYGRIFDVHRPEVVIAHHGIYVPQGIVTALARARGIRVVTWNPAYRRQRFIFSHDDTYHLTLMAEPTSLWSEAALTEEELNATLHYLQSRREGSGDWIRFHKPSPGADAADLAALGLDPNKPLVVAFTNVFWDAQLHYPARAFANQGEWLVDTVAWSADRPDLQLVIRVHPAEISGHPQSRQLAADELRRAFPTLPPNVIIVGPQSGLSSYGLAELADTALIYATKMGVELSALGIPVIVAGEAWVRNKGMTEDVLSREHYRQLLDKLPLGRRLDPGQRDRALRYAHHFFFRRMVAIAGVEESRGPRRFAIAARHLRELAPGSDAGLDVVCRGILEGTPFHHAPSGRPPHGV